MSDTRTPLPRRLALAWAVCALAASGTTLASPATIRAAPAVSIAEPLVLPATPSEMLRASAATWAPVLARLEAEVAHQLAQSAPRSPGQRSELYIHQVLLAQASGNWGRVTALTERARRLQADPSGRLLAGALNELLAQAQLARMSSSALSKATRDRFAAMPWPVVGAGLRTMHQQLQAMKPEQVENYAALRLDPSASIAKGRVDLGFAMQLVGARLQLTQVLPNREALVAGLGAVIAMHPQEAAAPKAEPASSAPSAN
jgi:hypothetical protein